MDVIGHAFSGALIGVALEPGPWLRDPAKLRPRWALVGALAATFPDVDAISYLFGADVFARVHQTYTHNVIAFALLPALMAWISARLGFGGRRVVALWYAGMAAHLLGDTIATWPLRCLLPFSDRGFAFALIQRDFSVAVALTLIGFTAISLWDPLIPARRMVALVGLASTVALVLFGHG